MKITNRGVFYTCLILCILSLGACTTRPVDPDAPEEINVFAENVGLVGESVGAVENSLICESDLAREWFFRPIGNALSAIVPFFAGANSICED